MKIRFSGTSRHKFTAVNDTWYFEIDYKTSVKKDFMVCESDDLGKAEPPISTHSYVESSIWRFSLHPANKALRFSGRYHVTLRWEGPAFRFHGNFLTYRLIWTRISVVSQ